ncbi:FAD:protein FMN transferase [Candidatus Saccharibacteria bacterium]|nr:FAD:protein FMN transferase [Candidatus Saccharibacteria bacterium]
MRKVEQIMGMPITIDIPEPVDKQVFDWCFARLKQIDQKFSLYKEDSEVSRYRRGEVDKPSPELAQIIRQCQAAEKKTNGYFSAWAGGQFDPSGYVKGWAIAKVGEIIEQSGHKTYCIAAGGDILSRSAGDKIWDIGIQDPTDKTKILNKLSISNGAVATSGNYERGAHINNPKTKRPAKELLSVTVTGPEIIWADVLATAVFAMGLSGLEFMKAQPAYQVLIIDNHGRQHKTAS